MRGQFVSDVLVERSEEGQPEPRTLFWFSPGQRATARAVSTLTTLLPLGRGNFERRLAHALREAAESGSGFFLKRYAARRALGSDLVVNIDPLRVSKRLKYRAAKEKRAYMQDRFVGAGNWAPMLHPLAASSTHRDVQEVIRSGFDYRNTRAYRHALDRARGASPVRRNFVALRSPQLVESYFGHITRLCRSIGENGVVPREE